MDKVYVVMSLKTVAGRKLPRETHRSRPAINGQSVMPHPCIYRVLIRTESRPTLDPTPTAAKCVLSPIYLFMV